MNPQIELPSQSSFAFSRKLYEILLVLLSCCAMLLLAVIAVLLHPVVV